MKVACVYNQNKEEVIEFLKHNKNHFLLADADFYNLEDDLTKIDAELVVTLGGDGTALKAIFVTANTRPQSLPHYLVVNFGRRGFLATFTPEEFAALSSLEEVTPRGRRLGQLTLKGKTLYFVNEAACLRGTAARVITLELQAGDLELATRGDGLIIATETGSSAYSYSAGGPILMGDDTALVCTFLASEDRLGSYVIGSNAQPIQVTVPDRNSLLAVDGALVRKGGPLELTLSISELTALFLKKK